MTQQHPPFESWPYPAPWYYRVRLWILERLSWAKDIETSGADTTCEITCDCGDRLWISEGVHWCQKCHRGWGVRFEVRRYPKWMYPGEDRLYREDK